MASRPSAALREAVREEMPAPSEDGLSRLREAVASARDLERTIGDLTERLSDRKRQLNEIRQKTLPDLFQEVGVKSVVLEPSGNLPAYEAEVRPYFSANIAADWDEERRERAFAWLSEQGEGDMIKTIYTVELGRGTSKMQKALSAALRKLKVAFSARKGVPHTTLTAWLRERYKKGEPLSPPELETIGATVGVVATLKEKK